MARTPRHVTEYELAILQVLWEVGPSTIRQITDAVYANGGFSPDTPHNAQQLLKLFGALKSTQSSTSRILRIF